MDIKMNKDGKTLKEVFIMSEERYQELTDEMAQIMKKSSINKMIQKGVEIAKDEVELVFVMVGIGAYIESIRPKFEDNPKSPIGIHVHKLKSDLKSDINSDQRFFNNQKF